MAAALTRRGGVLRVVDPRGDRRYQDYLDGVEAFAAELPERFLYCREMGHTWRPYTAGKYRDGGYRRALRCARCRCLKRQEIGPSGLIISTRYEHPEGYLTEGIGRLVGEARGVVRLESLRRVAAEEIEGDHGA